MTKNILILNYDAKIGGAEKVLITNCKILAETDNIILGLNNKGPLEQEIMKYCQKIYLLPIKSKISAFYRNKSLNHQLEEIIASENIDIIYLNSLKSLLLYFSALKNNKKKIILHLHDNISFTFFGLWAPLIKSILKKLSPQIISISSYSRQFIPKEITQVNVLHNTSPLDDNELSETVLPEGKNFLMVGRIAPWKGQLEVLKIMKNIILEDREVTLSFVGGPLFGETDYFQKLIDFSKANSLEKNVTFYDHIEDENKIIECYKKAKYVLHASVKPEPFGLVILEAMMFGRIIIASKYGAAPELINDGNTGFIFDPQAIEASEDKLRSILNLSGVQVELIGEKARESYKNNFSYQIYKKKLADIFKNFSVNNIN